MSKTTNKFAEALSSLLNEAKIFTRSNWASLLGVSEPAISQWTKGKHVPDADKLMSLVTIIRKESLSNFQKQKLDDLIAVLDLPTKDALGPEQNKVKENRLSGYMLQQLDKDLKGSLNLLFFDLQMELYQAWIKETVIIRQSLEEKLLGLHAVESENFHLKVTATQKLLHSYTETSKRQLLDNYVLLIKQVRKKQTEQLKSCLNRFDLHEKGHDPNMIDLLMTHEGSFAKKTQLSEKRVVAATGSGAIVKKTLHAVQLASHGFKHSSEPNIAGDNYYCRAIMSHNDIYSEDKIVNRHIPCAVISYYNMLQIEPAVYSYARGSDNLIKKSHHSGSSPFFYDLNHIEENFSYQTISHCDMFNPAMPPNKLRNKSTYMHWLDRQNNLGNDKIISFLNSWYVVSKFRPKMLLIIAANFDDMPDRKIMMEQYLEEDGILDSKSRHDKLLESLIIKLGGKPEIDKRVENKMTLFTRLLKMMNNAQQAVGFMQAAEYTTCEMFDYLEKMLGLSGHKDLLKTDPYIKRLRNMGKKTTKQLTAKHLANAIEEKWNEKARDMGISLWEDYWSVAFNKLDDIDMTLGKHKNRNVVK